MRTIKLLVLAIIAVALITMGAANMAPVNLFLLPMDVGGFTYSIENVPLAAVILASVFVGIVIGMLIELIRESKHRRSLAEKRDRIAALQGEIRRLNERIGPAPDDLPPLPQS